MDIFFKNNEFLFKLRVGYLVKHDNKILLSKNPNGTYFYLPGGKIEFGETSSNALKREIFEELKLIPNTIKELFHEETFYYSDFFKANVHEICFYFEVNLNMPKHMLNNEFEIFETPTKRLYFKWVNEQDLENINFVPQSILKYLNKPNALNKS